MEYMQEITTTTLLFGRAYGIYFAIVGFALLINPERFRAWYKEIMKSQGLLILGSVMALLIGSFIVSTHNIWASNWAIVITLIGWWGVFWGGILLIIPGSVDWHKRMVHAPDSVYRLSGLFWGILGLYIGYHGFSAVL